MKVYVFADEAGCFTFTREQNVSKYFIICTVTMDSTDVGQALSSLRHRLLWKGADLGDYFHATADKQAVRDKVFEEFLKFKFTVQATICEKSKAQPQVRLSKARFYQYPWYYHLRHGISKEIGKPKRLLVTAASIGSKKEKLTFSNAIGDVVAQTIKCRWAVDFRPSQTDPCLQVADYCAWAIQRKWERDDDRSYVYIKDRITYEYDLWQRGTKHFY